MKTMKRLVSVLLAGVLALAMLTACNGAGTSEVGKQFEEQYIAMINGIRTEEAGKLENDKTLRNEALQMLMTIDENGQIKGVNTMKMTQTADLSKTTMTIWTVLTKETDRDADKLYNAQELTAENISKILAEETPQYPDDPNTIKQMDAVEAIGVATIERNGKTYVAIAMRVSQPRT